METNKDIAILQYLRGHNGYFTSEELAIALQLNSRTIRFCINQLRDIQTKQGFELLSSPNLGYELTIYDEAKFEMFLQTLQGEDLLSKVLLRLLYSNTYLSVNALADQVFVSKSSIERILKEIRPMLSQFHLQLQNKIRNGIKITGSELDKRMCINYVLSLSAYQDITMKKQIEDIVFTILRKENYDTSHFNMNHLILHLVITIQRIRQNAVLEEIQIQEVTKDNPKEYRLAQMIADKIAQCYQLQFPYQEVCYVCMHLVGKKKFDNLLEIDDLAQIQTIVFEILERIDASFHFCLSNDFDLFVFLCLHVQPLIQRLKYGLHTNNPMLFSIKAEHPQGFDAAILAGEVIQSHTGCEMCDDELGYLALHFALAIEKSKTVKEQKRLLVVCASGMGTARLYKYKLAQKFNIPEQCIESIDAFHLDTVEVSSYDYLITTIPLTKVYPIPVIEIMNFQNDRHLSEAYEQIFEGGKDPLCFLEAGLFFSKKSISNKEEAISFLCQKVTELYPIEGLQEDVWRRERLSATEIGNAVAIPHPISSHYSRPIVAVLITDDMFTWEKQSVCFVFMVINTAEDMEVSEALSERLSDLYLDVEGLAQLKKVPTFETLIGLLSE